MPRDLDAGPLVALGGALLVLVSLFVAWYDPELGAWTVFEVWDLVLAVLGAAAAALALGRLDGPRGVRRLPWVGALIVLVVASQMLDAPPAAQGRGLEVGPWLALLGGAVVLTAGLLSTARVSVRMTVEERRDDAAAGGEPTAVVGDDRPPPGPGPS